MTIHGQDASNLYGSFEKFRKQRRNLERVAHYISSRPTLQITLSSASQRRFQMLDHG